MAVTINLVQDPDSRAGGCPLTPFTGTIFLTTPNAGEIPAGPTRGLRCQVLRRRASQAGRGLLFRKGEAHMLNDPRVGHGLRFIDRNF
jgi:hypothetical protein